MANIIRIKRRSTGAAGAPSVGSLLNAELAFNEVDNTLYYGRGADAQGKATEIIPIGGNGYVESTVNAASAALAADIASLAGQVASFNTDVLNTLAADLTALSAAVDEDTAALHAEMVAVSGTLHAEVVAAQSAAESYTDTKISDLIGGAPGALDTLKEIADQL